MSARTNGMRPHLALLLFAFLQFGFWMETRHLTPELGIVPVPPGKESAQALTFGDSQFYFRTLAFTIQNAGDTFGRFTALRYYDFNRLYYWFYLLDTLDARSDIIPALATYYFSQTQNAADVRYVVDYLYDHAMRDIGSKWWWLVQSIYLASHKLNDMDMALKVSAPLVDDRVPIWAQSMAAIVHEKRGEMEDAYRIIETIRHHAREIPEPELKFMRYFVEERLGRLDEMQQQGQEEANP